MIHPKSALIERSKQLGFNKPQFDTKRTGPQHEPTFISDAILNGEVYGTGQGGTKRDAERHASEEALTLLEQNAQTPNAAKHNQTGKNRTSSRSSNQTRKNGLTGNGISTQETATQKTDAQETATQETSNSQTTNQQSANQQSANQQTNNQQTTDFVDSSAQPVDELFEGPWPLVPDVLATSLHIANSRVNPGAQGADAIHEVHALAVELYKASLQSLGEVVEVDE